MRFRLDTPSLGLELLKLRVEPEKTAPQMAKDLMTQAQQGRSAFSTNVIIESIATTIIYKFPKMSRQEVAVMLGLVELQGTCIDQEGRQEGLEEGGQQEARSLILKLLTRKLGIISTETRSQIDALSVVQLERLREELLDFSTIDDLTTWFQDLP